MTDGYEYTVKLSRGTEKDDRDEQKVKVSAETIGDLENRVENVKAKLEDWADDFREIQPQDGRVLPDDQSELGEVKP